MFGGGHHGGLAPRAIVSRKPPQQKKETRPVANLQVVSAPPGNRSSSACTVRLKDQQPSAIGTTRALKHGTRQRRSATPDRDATTASPFASIMQKLTHDAESMTQDLKSKFRSDAATLALLAVHFVVGPIACTNDASVRFHNNCFRYSFHHPLQGHIGMIMYYEHMKEVLHDSKELRFRLSTHLEHFQEYDPDNPQHEMVVQFKAPSAASRVTARSSSMMAPRDVMGLFWSWGSAGVGQTQVLLFSSGRQVASIEGPTLLGSLPQKLLVSHPPSCNMSIGVPVKLFHEAAGHMVTIELMSGEVYRGT